MSFDKPVRSVLFFVFAALPAAAQVLQPPTVPADLKPSSEHTLFLKGQAMGTQNYICLPEGDGLAWKFQGPQATVFVKIRWINGAEILRQVATHYLSPNPEEDNLSRATWQSSQDSSAVWAKKVAETVDPAYVAPGAIPWFLLKKVGGQSGPTDGSFLAQTTYIQRVNTAGGISPTGACSVAGTLQFVPYTAEYYFYRYGGSI